MVFGRSGGWGQDGTSVGCKDWSVPVYAGGSYQLGCQRGVLAQRISSGSKLLGQDVAGMGPCQLRGNIPL